jgi:hypothetical protein
MERWGVPHAERIGALIIELTGKGGCKNISGLMGNALAATLVRPVDEGEFLSILHHWKTAMDALLNIASGRIERPRLIHARTVNTRSIATC